jgi:predicted Zn-dependent protease
MTSAPFSDPSRRDEGHPPEGHRDGESTFASYRRAETLLSQRRPLDAVQALLPVLAAQPDDASVQLLAGRAFLDSAQLRRAETAFTRVLEIDPADHYARFALGKSLQRQGRFTEALAQLRMAFAMEPRPEYQDAIAEVRARIAIGDPDPPPEA